MTKEFKHNIFNPDECRKEAHQLRDFLATSGDLKERKQILPFFKERLHLSAFLGSYHPEIVRYDLVAHEFPLFGEFVADLVVGDSKNSAFAFIEFEDALAESIFVKKSRPRNGLQGLNTASANLWIGFSSSMTSRRLSNSRTSSAIAPFGISAFL